MNICWIREAKDLEYVLTLVDGSHWSSQKNSSTLIPRVKGGTLDAVKALIIICINLLMAQKKLSTAKEESKCTLVWKICQKVWDSWTISTSCYFCMSSLQPPIFTTEDINKNSIILNVLSLKKANSLQIMWGFSLGRMSLISKHLLSLGWPVPAKLVYIVDFSSRPPGRTSSQRAGNQHNLLLRNMEEYLQGRWL